MVAERRRLPGSRDVCGRRAWIAAAACLTGVSPAAAHPHVWIRARAEIVFDASARLAAIRQSWTFDEAYSALMTLNLDSKGDGKPDADKLAEMAVSNLASVAESGYFTVAKANGKPVAFGLPQDLRQTFAEGRLRLEFTLPLASPMPPPRIMVLTVDDPSFFVAFGFEPGADAVRMAGPKTGCALAVNRPAQVAEEGRQLVSDDIAATAAPAVGTEYATRVILACP